MKSTIQILTLQELIKKVRCGNLINSAVLKFENGIISAEGKGIEVSGRIDGSMSFSVQYPTIIVEAGETSLSNLQDLSSKIEIYEKEDQVPIFLQENKLIINRESPKLLLTYDIADKKFIPTHHKDTGVRFGNPTILSHGTETVEISYHAEITFDSLKLFPLVRAIEKIKPTKINLQIKDGSLNVALKGIGSDLFFEIKGDKSSGEALAKYDVVLMDILNVAFGTVTIMLGKVGTDLPIWIHFEQDAQKADYLLNSS